MLGTYETKLKNGGNLGKHITVETKVKTTATKVNILQILGTNI